MPGLKQLEYFKNELSRLGNERQVTEAWGESYEELPIPARAPVPETQTDIDTLLSSIGDVAPPPDSGIPEVEVPEVESFETPVASDDGLASLDDLLASLPLGNSDEGSRSDRSQDAAPTEDFSVGDLVADVGTDSAAGGARDAVLPDDFALPDDLLAGFANDIETARASDDEPIDSVEPLDAVETPGGDEPVESIESLEAESPVGAEPSGAGESTGSTEPVEDFGSLDSFDLGSLTESPAAAPASDTFEIPDFSALSDGSAGDASVGDESIGDAFAMPDFGETDGSPASFDALSGADAETGAGTSPGAGTDAVSGDEAVGELPSLGEMDFTPSFEIPAESAAAAEKSRIAEKFGEEFSDFQIPADLGVSDDAAASAASAPGDEASGIDGFDGFSLDEDFLKTGIDSADAADDEFHIPGFSDFTSGGAARAQGPAAPAAGGMPAGARRAKKEIPLEISESDLRRLLEELAAYPLNLKIAVEEFLSGDIGTDLQKMTMVHDILNDAPLRKTARTLEGLLSRSIPIPKDFEKKTIAEYEQEKASFRYVLVNKIAPAAVLFAIVATLTACTVFLVNEFVVQPLIAESLYKKGYEAIREDLYSQAMDSFDKAVAVKDKKPWYFKYARAFRDKRQYLLAGEMYERLLNRFKNDKAGGLEYAEMLRTDLRNFEKAETIIKRRLLDNYVNDPDAMLLLGDTYLDWAEENPAKYEEARSQYARLIELYGKKDPYLARMMRFFVRTDNLKEVLPLKEHFMSKRAKIGSDDLIELSGYLLDKRYNPAPGDNEALRDQIEDVRALLERSIKADESSPEAHYNMARFFIYNYKTDAAKAMLTRALDRFENAQTMSPKRVLSHVDAWRLLGELLSDDMEYLKARDLFASGLTLYEDQRRNRSVRQSPLVGMLYADLADLDYFISGDFGSAMANYEKAVAEMNDTPSIRYRIGYIAYQNQDYERAMNEFILSYAEKPADRNVLFAFGNALFRRGDYFAAQGYLERLQETLEAERIRKGILLPQVRADHGEFVELYMHAANNLAVDLDRIATRTGDSRKRARALALLSESARAWDALTRNPETMVRAQGSNLAYLNIQNITHPLSAYVPEIYQDIPKTLENEKILQQRVDR
jgi:hypothetical protein